MRGCLELLVTFIVQMIILVDPDDRGSGIAGHHTR